MDAPKERDLKDRCGSCGWFIKLRTDDAGAAWGECQLGCWHPPLKDTNTCSSYKQFGASFEGSLKRKKAAGTPRRYRDDEAPVVRRPTIPKEIGIDMDQDEFRQVLREVLLDELGIRDVPIGERWSGGEVVLKPGKEDTQEKTIPLDVFFRKIVMVRDKLRVLEQKVNGSKSLKDDEKVQLQQYITACYGSLTTFNVLFKDKKDHFVGQKK
ncbi:MAG: hypothetical protein AAGE52_22470 [Myxococcota bacterium]